MTRLAAAFLEQASHCDKLGSAFMARLLRLVAQHWPIEGALAQRLEAWPGDIGPKGASLPLRLASALHALVLNGQSAQLRSAYPPHHTNDDQLIKAVQTTLTRHGRFIENWLTHPPQTNEVARSAGLIPAAMWLQHQYKLPIFLSELGASAGLNLGFDRFALTVPGHRFGPDQPILDLAPDWYGPVPTGLWPHIAERGGVDLNPLDPTKPEDATRLIAYQWPDQPERIARTRAAIAHHSANVDAGDAIDWLAHRLKLPRDGHLHLIYHTIAWQYFPPEQQARGRALLAHAGAQATKQTPLAWLSIEADASDQQGAAITLQLWPANVIFDLGRADFHGRWIDWIPPK